jgi:branched-chain amino acid transport system ATP-binding protein
VTDGIMPDATMRSPLLSLRKVNAYYGESHILHDVSFDLFPGDIVGILGRNGVGKTTTLQTILGVPAPRTGEISFRGEALVGLLTSQIVSRGIGWVPQGHRIFPTLSVLENLELAAARARPGAWTLAKIYQRFPRLDARRHARGDALSGGEQQMLAIARALVQNPEVFLMDEPSEGLSPLVVQEVGALIKELNGQGVSILLVEQNLAFALSVAQRILIMNKGAIVYAGTPAQIEADPEISHSFLGMGLATHRRAAGDKGSAA